jgi:molecular chaperone GrpE
MQKSASEEEETVDSRDGVETPAETVVPAEGDAGETPEAGGAPDEDELAKWREIAVRATAELDNFRKRMAREKTDALRFANQRLLEELLPVLDNFEMGLQAAEQDSGSMIYQGMKMVKGQLDGFLAGQGVVEVEAEGARFDPNVHEAVSQEESDEVPEGTILRVTRRGFRINDRLLRPANVVVAKAVETGGEGGE